MLLSDNLNHEVVSNMTAPQLRLLCRELRGCILRVVMENGGHLSSSLGAVELAAALNYVFDAGGEDKILYDVGHQAYAHKLLTGRYSRFGELRRKNGISGFMRSGESCADAFISGHSSNSISAAYGLSEAMRINGEKGAVAAVIGDGALTGGQAYEALNNAGKTASNLTLVLNDNAMSIGKSTGAVARYLSKIRLNKKYFKAKESVKGVLSRIPVVGKPTESFIVETKQLIKSALYDSSNLFENLGFTYIGPVDGHNIEDLIEALSAAKYVNRPCIVHVFTKKGKGYLPAEKNPGEYHAVASEGVALDNAENGGRKTTFTEVFGREMARLGNKDAKLCAITAAMKYATGLNFFKKRFPNRFYDAGIAEAHSVTFSAGLAAGGMRPVFAVYSTFLQRGFDQMIHDCAIENTHVTLAIDRAGLVGEDGETHQGLFDVPMLRLIPNTSVFAPASFAELRICLRRAIYKTSGIAAVRYPKGGEPRGSENFACTENFEFFGKRSRVLAVTYGRISADCARACAESGADLLRLVRIIPLPQAAFDIAAMYDRIIFFEEGSVKGGAGEDFIMGALKTAKKAQKWEIVGINGEFPAQATVDEQLDEYGLSERKMTEKLREFLISD